MDKRQSIAESSSGRTDFKSNLNWNSSWSGPNWQPQTEASSRPNRSPCGYLDGPQKSAQTESKTILKKPSKTADRKIVKSRKFSIEQTNPCHIPAEVNWLHNVYPQRVPELMKLMAVIQQLEVVANQISFSIGQEAPNTEHAPDQNQFDDLERQALEQYQPSDTSLTQQIDENFPYLADSDFRDLERQAMEQYGNASDTQIFTPSINRNLDQSVSKFVWNRG
ncbi:Hypothetical protein NTJ_12213 [Nesidiocoris tenuis]|uniref:Uncharacterized protein n=1 Tax=Nesidiocoris tenuis TaxID=355587 RepID=A0ABN7B4Q1_9HEMI|nr:Hypothetical protein NTJ_12213 [Nesidiocoris tenuis]